MNSTLTWFERVVRRAHSFDQSTEAEAPPAGHPFDERNIHPDIAVVSLHLFDDGHYAQATFEAFKYIDKQVREISGISETGYKLMMNAFNEAAAKIKLTNLLTMSEKDEQRGFCHMFAGAAVGIRNPRGHEVKLKDGIELCLDHLSVASMLLRRLEQRVAP
jgi:uncharacterized protein (TIGR02391 family)